MKKCPLCNGSGEDNSYEGITYLTYVSIKCPFCKGSGRIPMKLYMDYVRAYRRVENYD